MSKQESIIFPVKVQRDGKHLIINFGDYPVDIKSNITIKARKKSSNTTQMKSIVLVYREKIV